MRVDVGLALVALGSVVVALAAVGALALRGTPIDRLHLVTPVTSFGAPVVGTGLCVLDGWGLAAAEVLLVVGLLAVSGPSLNAAIGRLLAQGEGAVPQDPPD